MAQDSPYTREELGSIYELGRMYFEMGYLAPAERIFAGLAGIDVGQTAAKIGLGLLKLERGLFQEATGHFRASLQAGSFPVQAKLGLVMAFLGLQEMPRARTLLAEVGKEMKDVSSDTRQLAEALAKRCGG